MANILDYDFNEARKPCGTDKSGGVKTSGRCIENAKIDCRWFPMCDLSCKNPPEAPTRPKIFTKPLRGFNARIFAPRSQFFEKEKKMKNGKNYRLQDLGRMAVFYIPSTKARKKGYDKKIRDFLLEEFGACTATLGNFCGWWKSDKSEKMHYDENIEFKVAFVGKERIPILASFLAKIVKDLDEECIYLETGEDAWLVYPTDDLKEGK